MAEFQASDVVFKASEAIFGRALVTNVHRGHLVEAMIALALEPTWRWCASNYSSWDFDDYESLRIEVKQSAARQSWATSERPSACSFDIAKRKGRWEGDVWIDGSGRAAQIYVFAHHPVADATADHREPSQWQFYVVRTTELPATRRISIARLASTCDPVMI